MTNPHPQHQAPNPNERWQPSSEWRDLLPLGLDAAAQLDAEERAPLDMALADQEDPAAREELAAYEEALQPLRALRERPAQAMPAQLALRVKAAVQAELAAASPVPRIGLGAFDTPPRVWFAAAAAVMLAVGAAVWVAAMVGVATIEGDSVRPSAIGSGLVPPGATPQPGETVDDDATPPGHHEEQRDDQDRSGVGEFVDEQSSDFGAASWPQAFEVSSRDEVRASNDRIHGMRSLDGNHRAGGVRYATSDAEPMGDASGTALPRGEVVRDPNQRSATF